MVNYDDPWLLREVVQSGVWCSWVYSRAAGSRLGPTRSRLCRMGGPSPGPYSLPATRRHPPPSSCAAIPTETYCGALSDGSGYRFLREVAVGPDQGLKDVIVTIQGIEKGKPFTFEETNLETNICQFVPFVSVMRDQHLLVVKNLDSVSHDLQIYEREREHIFMMFHRPALTKGGTRDLIRFTGNRRGVIMQCGMHAYMQGHGLAVDNPYYAITGLEGTFAIKDLPSGTYRIKAWHPILGEKVQDVTVAANGTSSLDFSFEAR